MLHRRLFVLVGLGMGMFVACADTENPVPSPTTPPADSGAKTDAKKDTGGTIENDSGGEEEDAGTKKDSGKDTGEDPDTGDEDAGDQDADPGDTGTTDTGSDTGATDTGTQDTGSDTGSADAGCNDLVYGTAQLTIQNTTAAAPTATGGTIPNGTFNLSSYKQYGAASNGSGTATLRAAFAIKNGNTIESLQNSNGIELRRTGSFTLPSANTIRITWTCGSVTSVPEDHFYTVSAGNILYYPLPASTTYETTFSP